MAGTWSQVLPHQLHTIWQDPLQWEKLALLLWALLEGFLSYWVPTYWFVVRSDERCKTLLQQRLSAARTQSTDASRDDANVHFTRVPVPIVDAFPGWA